MILWILLILGVSSTAAVRVEFTGEWVAGVGWQLTCKWRFPAGDQLQSVRLEKDDQQFQIYRPETHGSSVHDTFFMPGSWTQLDCSTHNSSSGSCSLTMQLQREPLVASQYTCETSGERPRFNIDSKSLQLVPYVPATDTAIEVVVEEREKSAEHVLLNCSASGLPAPGLKWLVGDQMMQGDFFSGSWNASSKLRHVWSTLSITRPSTDTTVLCTPTQHARGVGSSSGVPAQLVVSAGERVCVGYRIEATMFILLSFLLR